MKILPSEGACRDMQTSRGFFREEKKSPERWSLKSVVVVYTCGCNIQFENITPMLQNLTAWLDGTRQVRVCLHCSPGCDCSYYKHAHASFEPASWGAGSTVATAAWNPAWAAKCEKLSKHSAWSMEHGPQHGITAHIYSASQVLQPMLSSTLLQLHCYKYSS